MVWPREDFLSANDSDFRFMAGSLDINTFSVDLRSASYSIGSILFLMPDKYERLSLCVYRQLVVACSWDQISLT